MSTNTYFLHNVGRAILANQVTSPPITFSACNMKIVQGRDPIVNAVSILDLGDIATLVFWIENQGAYSKRYFLCN